MTDSATDPNRFDVVVAGATPGGIASAIAAARGGCSVLLLEYHHHIGGMSSSGLGKSDVEKRHLIGGLFQEFTEKVKQHYLETCGEESDNYALCHEGYYFEPSVAEKIFDEMIQSQAKITLRLNCQITRAEMAGNRGSGIEFENRANGIRTRVSAKAFIDATYEGDLLALSGAGYRLGRESRDEFHEPHAGRIYYDYENGVILPGSTGEGDDRLPAYTFRLCLSMDPANAEPISSAPEDYNRNHYTPYLDDLKKGRLRGPKNWKPGRGYEPSHFDTMVRALSVTSLPNGKTDVNINPRPLGFPFAEENTNYVTGSDACRQTTTQRIRNLTLGLLFFLQNDTEILEEHRAIARQYHPARDEFTDNGFFPFQLYVREARRLKGEYTLTEHDITCTNEKISEHHPDTIAIGEFPIDSFPCRKKQPQDTVVLEGYLGMLDSITRPYEIPYRIMIPESVDGLIVPVAASTTHVAFSSIRMEPTWMALGQAAGTAAALAIKHGTSFRKVPIPELQSQLLRDGQVIRHFEPDQ